MQGLLLRRPVVCLACSCLMVTQVTLVSIFLWHALGPLSLLSLLIAAPSMVLCGLLTTFRQKFRASYFRWMLLCYISWLLTTTPILYSFVVLNPPNPSFFGEKTLLVSFQLSIFVLSAIFRCARMSGVEGQGTDLLYKTKPRVHLSWLEGNDLRNVALDVMDASGFFSIASLRQLVPDTVHALGLFLWFGVCLFSRVSCTYSFLTAWAGWPPSLGGPLFICT